MVAHAAQVACPMAQPLPFRRVSWTTSRLLFAIALVLAAADAAHARTSSAVQDAACAAPHVEVHVKTWVGPVSVATDYTFKHFAMLARQNDKPLKHPPYGFSLSGVSYILHVQETDQAPNGCAVSVLVTADVALVDRRIEIASDFLKKPCFYQVLLEHYELHAEADRHEFVEYAAKLPARIKAAVTKAEKALGGSFSQKARTATDEVISGLQDALSKSQHAVDRTSVVDKLAHPACSA